MSYRLDDTWAYDEPGMIYDHPRFRDQFVLYDGLGMFIPDDPPRGFPTLNPTTPFNYPPMT